MTNENVGVREDIDRLIDALDKIHTLSNGNPNHARPEVMLAIIHDLAERVLEDVYEPC